jgi:hypothetical protein
MGNLDHPSSLLEQGIVVGLTVRPEQGILALRKMLEGTNIANDNQNTYKKNLEELIEDPIRRKQKMVEKEDMGEL